MTGACQGSDGQAGPSANTSPTPLASPSPAPSPSIPTVRQVDSWKAPGTVTLQGQVFGDRAVWTGGPRDGEVNTVYLRDLRRHKTLVLATARSRWRADWVKADGDWVVYMEASGEASADEPDPKWRMHLLNVVTGKSRLVTTSERASGGLPPSPQIDAGQLVWAQRSSKNLFHIMAMKVTDSSPRVLVRNRRVHDSGITQGQVVFDAEVAGVRDLFAVPFQGGEVRQLTTRAKVRRANVAEGLVGYEEGDTHSDPVRQWVLPVSGGKPQLVTRAPAQGEVASSNITPGAGMLSWFSSDGAVLSDLGGTWRESLTDSPSIQLRFDWDGRRVMWGETKVESGKLVTTIHLSDIVLAS